jgi:hypothetical protein
MGKCPRTKNRYNIICNDSNTCVDSKMKHLKSLQVLGPFNTGTNLMYNILSNYEFDNLDFMYKHEINSNIIEKEIQDDSKIFIIMYKPLYNWLYSIQKDPYDIKFIENRFEGRVRFCGNNYKNVIELYNYYYKMYKNFAQYDNVLILDYFKIIAPDGFNYLKSKLQKLSIDYTDQNFFKNQMNTPSKSHGNSVKNSRHAFIRAKTIEKEWRIFVNNKPLLRASLDNKLYDYFFLTTSIS